MAGPRLNAFGVVVSDMARSIGFYRQLGVEFPDGAETEAHVSAELGGGVRLMLDTEEVIASFDPDWSASAPGRVSLAVELDNPADVDRLYGELASTDLGYKEPWDAFWGQRYAQLRDPDGTAVDLYAALPDAGGASAE